MESESQTRRSRIDGCLRQSGWIIIPWSRRLDISSLTHHAVEEYPTANGPADYALVVGGQTLIEKHLEALLGVRFLASEYVTGKTHGGRIDTLRIDENRCAVIIEYKRALNENVVSQGPMFSSKR